MAQDAFAAGRKDRRHPASRSRDKRVSDRVDAAVQRVQPAQRDASIDRITAEADVQELPATDDPVLARR